MVPPTKAPAIMPVTLAVTCQGCIRRYARSAPLTMPTQATAKPTITRPLSRKIFLRSALIISSGIAAATTYWPTKSATRRRGGDVQVRE